MDIDMDSMDVIIDDEPLMEREDRPRARTWPILPPPIETIHEHERDAEIAEPPPIIEEVELEEEINESQKTEANPRKNSRKNAWGNLSYADLITQAIQTAPEQRLTLSQIYEWMVRNIAYFKDKGDSTSSAGWKNSIRHNLSLHNRFMRVQNDSNGKSSYWVINADAKPGKSSRRRSGSVDGQQPKGEKKRIRNKKLHQSTDDISALSPNSIKFKQNRSYDNLLNATSPCSSTDSLANLDEFHTDLVSTPYAGDSFARPRSTSNVSSQSSVNGRMTPIHGDIDGDLLRLDENQLLNGGADEATINMVEAMRIDNHYATNINTNITINLNDSLKLVKTDQKYVVNVGGNNDPILPPRRAHSDSFGSGDSGYDSPAAYFPPSQVSSQSINGPNRVMSKMSPTSNAIPNKPPPPYNQGFPQSLRQHQPMYNLGDMPQNGFFSSQSMAQHPVRSNMSNQSAAPRLKHLPLSTPNNTYSVQSQSNQVYNQHLNRSFSMGVQNNNTTVFESNAFVKQEYENHSKTFSSWDNMDIPSDLHQVKLFDFQDQQQLASDLDAIIKSDLNASGTSLQCICEPYNRDIKPFNRDINNNNKVMHPQYVASFPAAGQDWVR